MAATEPDALDSLSGTLMFLICCQDSLALKAALPVKTSSFLATGLIKVSKHSFLFSRK